MSVQASYQVVCDKCGRNSNSSNWIDESARKALDNARCFGWVRVKSGVRMIDLCQYCRDGHNEKPLKLAESTD